MKYRAISVGALVLVLLPLIGAGQDKRGFTQELSPDSVRSTATGNRKQDKREFTKEFPLGECEFKTVGGNRYFILEPGRQLHLNNFRCVTEGRCNETEEVVITVLNETRDITLDINGQLETVTTRVVEERETVDGELAEISRNFFAECSGTQDVYYFGEDVDIYEGGVIVSHEGAWLAGSNGAKPGVIMPGGAFLLGARYFQELAPGVAMDRSEHVDMDLSVGVPAGNFTECVEVKETTPLDKKAVSMKTYCPDTGLVIDEDLELISVVE